MTRRAHMDWAGVALRMGCNAAIAEHEVEQSRVLVAAVYGREVKMIGTSDCSGIARCAEGFESILTLHQTSDAGRNTRVVVACYSGMAEEHSNGLRTSPAGE